MRFIILKKFKYRNIYLVLTKFVPAVAVIQIIQVNIKLVLS